MKTSVLGLLAETPIHPGSGRGLGVVDLPVAREAATDYPVLVGSSLKGALRDKARNTATVDEQVCFGSDERDGSDGRAGDMLVSDARLLLLPVRSLTGTYRWATCPHLIERYRRDLRRADPNAPPVAPVEVEKGSVSATGDGHLFLEERQFSICGQPQPQLTDAIAPLLLHQETQDRLPAQIAVLHDDDFAWFARYGLAIQARNVLDGDTKQSKNLWYEETLPPDTVLYAVVMARNEDAAGALDSLFSERDPYLQAGGNETIGHGWFAVTVRTDGSEPAQ